MTKGCAVAGKVTWMDFECLKAYNTLNMVTEHSKSLAWDIICLNYLWIICLKVLTCS